MHSISELVQSIFIIGEHPDQFPCSALISLLVHADDCYFNSDDPIITDSQYDFLKQYVHNMDPTNPYFIGVGSETRGGKIQLPYPMGSLDQIYTGDYIKWTEKHNLNHEHIVVSDKLDGTSCMIVYDDTGKLQIAYSRGDGTRGADITRHINKVQNVPKQLNPQLVSDTLVVRAEVIISIENFKKIKDVVVSRSGRPYKNPRNTVSGVMNAIQNNDMVYDLIEVIPYQIVNADGLSKQQQLTLLKNLGFSIVHYSVEPAKSLSDSVLSDLLTQRRLNSEYEIDGLVLEVDSASTRHRVNPSKETLNPAYAVKFKTAGASNYADVQVVNIEYNISKDGYLKPRVQIEPTELGGVTIQYLSGFNANFIFTNRIGPKSIIGISRAGDVIPVILSATHPMPLEKKDGASYDDLYQEWFYGEISKTANGSWKWNDTHVDIIIDSYDNPIMKFERLVDFFATIEVPHLGEGNLRYMFDAGFDTPESIIELHQQDISSLIGSPSIGKKIYNGIRDKFTNIHEYMLMGAHPSFGRGVGVRKMKKLWEACRGDISKLHDIQFIVSVDGFDIKTASKIANGIQEYQAFKEYISPYITILPYAEPKQGSMTGQNIVITGFRSKPLEQQIIDNGGVVGNSVTKNTTIVIADDPNSTSGKAQKARTMGIKIMSLAEFQGMI